MHRQMPKKIKKQGEVFMILTNNLLPIIITIICLIVLILAFILFIILKNKKPKVKVNDEFINNLEKALGKKENINNIKMINGRLHFEVNDLDIVDLDELKKLSTAGVFITNQTIKMLFSYNSKAIITALNRK